MSMSNTGVSLSSVIDDQTTHSFAKDQLKAIVERIDISRHSEC